MDDIVAVLFFLLVGIGIAIWLLYRAADWFCRIPYPLRYHAFAATAWTVLTFCQTVSILAHFVKQDFVEHAVLFVASSVMVASWSQFAERRRGETVRQARRPLPYRLFVQTVWGVIVLWTRPWDAIGGAQYLLDTTAGMQGASYSQARHVGNIAQRDTDLVDAVREQNISAVRAALKNGVSFDAGDVALRVAVMRPNVDITRSLFDCGFRTDTSQNYVPLLLLAVEHGQIGQAQLLLHRGADPNVSYVSASRTPLKVAKRQGNKPMIHLLEGAGATR